MNFAAFALTVSLSAAINASRADPRFDKRNFRVFLSRRSPQMCESRRTESRARNRTECERLKINSATRPGWRAQSGVSVNESEGNQIDIRSHKMEGIEPLADSI